MDQNRIEGTVRGVAGKAETAVGNATGDVKTQLNGKLDQAAGAIQDAAGKASDAMQGVADKASETTGEFIGAASAMAGNIGVGLQNAARKAGEQASEVGDHIYHRAVDAGQYAGERIKEQPLTAMLIASALGGVIGFLLGRASYEEPPTLRDRMGRVISNRLR